MNREYLCFWENETWFLGQQNNCWRDGSIRESEWAELGVQLGVLKLLEKKLGVLRIRPVSLFLKAPQWACWHTNPSCSDSLGLPIPLGSHRRDCSCELRYKFGFIYSVKSHNFVFLPNLNHRKSGMHLHNTNNGFFKIFMMSFYGCYLFKFWTSDSSECVWAFKYFVIILSCFYSMTIIKENGLTTRAWLSLPDVSS